MSDEPTDPFAKFLGRAAKTASKTLGEVKKTIAEVEKSEAWANTKETAQRTFENVQDTAKKTMAEVEESEAWKNAREGAKDLAGKAGEKAKDAVARARASTERAAETGLLVVKTLKDATKDIEDRTALIDKFVLTTDRLSNQYDALADAFSVGYFAQAGPGVAGVTGLELRYVRGTDVFPPYLRVSKLEGKTVRLAVGAQTSAYAGCYYGDAGLLSRSVTRRGGDAGILMASLAFFRAVPATDDKPASGWLFALNLGLELGIPFLSDLTAFEIGEERLASFELTAAEVTRIEHALDRAEDHSRRRGLAQSLS